jgi:hypothetical protein
MVRDASKRDKKQQGTVDLKPQGRNQYKKVLFWFGFGFFAGLKFGKISEVL